MATFATMSTRPAYALLIGCVLLARMAHAQSFEGLGTLDDIPLWYAESTGISSDGGTIVGRWLPNVDLTREWAFVWRTGVGMRPMSFPALVRTNALDVSGDGSTVLIVGNGVFHYVSAPGTGTRWIGDLGGGGRAYALSADGMVVVGTRNTATSWPDVHEAFRWTAATGIDGLGFTEARDVSADGKIIVGSQATLNEFGTRTEEAPYVWRDGAGSVVVETLHGHASAVSDDGSAVVGSYLEGPRGTGVYHAFRERNGITILDSAASNVFAPFDVSDDGAVVVGEKIYPALGLRGFQAAIWTEEHGLRTVEDVLANDLGIDIGGWQLQRATGISADGRVITGFGLSPSNRREVWRVVLDERTDERVLVVSVTGDEQNHPDSTTVDECDVDRAQNAPQCTLRAALELANARGGGTITFDIPGGGVPAIQMAADSPSLPALAGPIVIDGTTQPGAGRVRLIGPGTFNSNRRLGVEIEAAGAGSTVRGLIVHGFRGAGILLRPGADDCLIEDNWLGTDGDGIEAHGNGGTTYSLRSGHESGGLVLLSDRNVVQANVLAGNGILNPETGSLYPGVDVLIGPGADLNQVRGNRIGVGADGQPIRFRLDEGDFLADYVPLMIAGGVGNIIGASAPESAGRPVACVSPCNLIGGAIRVQAFDDGPPPSGTRIAGNFIGVDPSAEPFQMEDDRGGGIGQFNAGSDNVVADNVIYDSNGQNVSLIGGQGHRITGNLLLADPAPSGLSADMLFGAVSVTDVEDVEISGNEISAGSNWGIVISGESGRIVVSGNTITGRRHGGIGLDGTDAFALLTQNLTPHTPIGIDLGMDGITPNDPGDADGGANDLQNFPVVNAAVLTGGALALEGYFEVPFTTLATYRLEVFSSSRCADGPLGAGGSPQGQAERYLGSAAVDPLLGDVDFAFTLDGVADDHRFLALTASQPANGITSELSRCVAFARADRWRVPT